jgi:hypothetical protein
MDKNVINISNIHEIDDDGYVEGTPEYRIALVSDITNDVWTFIGARDVERRLQRDVVNIIRRKS